MMRKLTFFLLVVFCVGLVGCSKDGEVNAFITEWDATTNEMIQKINANPTAEGVDEAQKVFDGKKASLKTKWDSIKDARGIQVSSDTQKKLTDSAEKNSKALMDGISKVSSDPDAMTKYQKLVTDYSDTFKM
jgi:hypothetical protein